VMFTAVDLFAPFSPHSRRSRSIGNGAPESTRSVRTSS
jgi:hypothetical protein